MPSTPDEEPTLRPELANAITHGLGAVAAMAALPLLVVLAVRRGDVYDVVGTAVFGATMVVLYFASTLYHAVPAPVAKARLKIFDHSAIYLLIAGTYTPFMIGSMRGEWGWSLLAIIWGLAFAGVVFKLLFIGRFPRLSTAIYVAMGWLIVIAIVPMVNMVPPDSLIWLIAGGLAYTAGTFFYQKERFGFSHAVWHMFVLTGSGCHTVAVALQI